MQFRYIILTSSIMEKACLGQWYLSQDFPTTDTNFMQFHIWGIELNLDEFKIIVATLTECRLYTEHLILPGTMESRKRKYSASSEFIIKL